MGNPSIELSLRYQYLAPWWRPKQTGREAQRKPWGHVRFGPAKSMLSRQDERGELQTKARSLRGWGWGAYVVGGCSPDSLAKEKLKPGQFSVLSYPRIDLSPSVIYNLSPATDLTCFPTPLPHCLIILL